MKSDMNDYQDKDYGEGNNCVNRINALDENCPQQLQGTASSTRNPVGLVDGTKWEGLSVKLEVVFKIIHSCDQYRAPILPYEGAMSIECHTLSSSGGVCIDMSMMEKLKAGTGEGCGSIF